MSIPWVAVQFIFTAVSMIYQQRQASKLRAAAKDRAATRDIKLSGSNSTIPIVYGYSRIDPINVYTKSFNSLASLSGSNPTEQVVRQANQTGKVVLFNNTKAFPVLITSVILTSSGSNPINNNLFSVSGLYGIGTETEILNNQIVDPKLGAHDLTRDRYTGDELAGNQQFWPGTGNINLLPGHSLVTYKNETQLMVYDISSEDVSAIALGALSPFSGSSNELLATQNVLSAASLNKVVWADIDNVTLDNDAYKNWIKLVINQEGSSLSGSSQIDSARPNATFENLAYTTEFFKMNRDKPQFAGKPITAYYVEGRRIRTLTNNVLSSERIFSNNTVFVLLDYLLDSEFGPGLSQSDLDLESFQIAANIADTVLKTGIEAKGYIFEKQGITTRDIKLHEFNGITLSDQDHFSNIAKILDTIIGSILYRDPVGKIKLSIPNPYITPEQTSVGSITDTYLIEDVSFSQADTNNRLNQLKVNFSNISKNFANDSFETTKANYKLQDNNIRLITEITAEGVNNVYQAEALANVKINESRLDSYEFKTSHEMLIYQPGDVVRLKSDYHNIDQYIRITGMDMNPDLTIDFTGVQYNSDVYNPAVETVSELINYDTFDFSIKQPSNLQTAVLTNDNTIFNSIELTWEDADDINVREYIIQAGNFDSENQVYVWHQLAVVSYGVQRFVHSPNVPAAYFYRIKSKGSDRWILSSSGFISLQQVLGGLSVTSERESITINRSVTNSVTYPDSDTISYSVNLGKEQGTYSSTGNLPSKGWRIITPSGDLANNQGTFTVNNNGTVTIDFNQELGSYVPTNTLILEIVVNYTVSEVDISSNELVHVNKAININELKDSSDVLNGINGVNGIDGLNGSDGLDGLDGADGADGENGLSVVQLQVFKRSSSTPSTPTGGSFNFDNLSLTPPEGWSSTIPAGADPVYTSFSVGSVSGGSGTDSTLTWSSAAFLVQNGTNGEDGSSGTNGISTYQAPIFKRSSTQLDAPTGGSFNFGTNTLTPPTGWSIAIPSGTEPIYSANYQFSISGDTGTDTATTWSTPNVIAENGSDGSDGSNGSDGLDGSDGISTFQIAIYKRSSVAITTVPTGGSYNFGTQVITTPTDWTSTVPAGTDPIYISTTLASIQGTTGIDSSLSWTVPTLFVQNGANGTNGADGADGADGTNGTNGTNGTDGADGEPGARGPGWWRIVESATQEQLDGYNSTTISTKFTTYTGFAPVEDDVFIISGTSPAVKAWIFTSGSWAVQTEFIDGNLLVAGTVTANKIDSRGLSIKDAEGNVIFASGNALDPANIDVPSTWDTTTNIAASISGQGIFATAPKLTSGNISTYISDLSVDTARIGDNAVTTAVYGSYNGFIRWWEGSINYPIEDNFASISFNANAGDIVLIEATYDFRINTKIGYVWNQYTAMFQYQTKLVFNGNVSIETPPKTIAYLDGGGPGTEVSHMQGWGTKKVLRETVTVTTSGNQTLALIGSVSSLLGGFGSDIRGSYSLNGIVLSAFIRRK